MSEHSQEDRCDACDGEGIIAAYCDPEGHSLDYLMNYCAPCWAIVNEHCEVRTAAALLEA